MQLFSLLFMHNVYISWNTT